MFFALRPTLSQSRHLGTNMFNKIIYYMGLLDFFRNFSKTNNIEKKDNTPIRQVYNPSNGNPLSPSNNNEESGNSVLKPSFPIKHTPMLVDWEKEYAKKLPTGLKAAGWFIQKYFQDQNIKAPSFRWIQTKLTYPAFQHLCFAHYGNVYSVIIEFDDGISSHILSRDVKNQLRECQENDMIPCTIVLKYDTYEPIINGNHLIHTDKRTALVFQKREGDVRMSAWEINNFAVSIVIQQLEKEGFKILSFCDVLRVEPQIWFEAKNGKRSYVIVKAISGSSKENLKYKINHNLIMRLKDYDGYFAEVGIFPASPIAKDENGNILNITEMDNFENPKEILFRDESFYINYKGLKFIEKQAAEQGIVQNDLYDIQ